MLVFREFSVLFRLLFTSSPPEICGYLHSHRCPSRKIGEAQGRDLPRLTGTCQGLRAPWLARKACIGGTKGLGLLGRPADRGGQRENPDLPTDRPGRRESGFGWEGWGKEIQMKSPHYWLTRKA